MPGICPNLEVDPQGRATTFHVLGRLQVNGESAGLLDADGAALIVDLGVDDQWTDPAGQSGSRWACGVIELRRLTPRAGA